MFDPNTSAAVAAIAAAVTAVLTLAICLANVFQTLAQARASDFENCLNVVTKLAEAQRLVRDAQNDAVRQFEFRELLNLMEALALLSNDKRIEPSTKKVTEHFLNESWAFLLSQDELAPLLEASVTSDSTFLELSTFAKKREKRISGLRRSYRAEQTPTADSATVG